MKKVFLIIPIFLFVSCKKDAAKDEVTINKNPIAHGKELFEGKGNCVACHLVDQKIIGPCIQEISKIYKNQNADLVNFLKGNGEPIVDPSQYEVMKTNFAITKTMSDEELKAIESYIYSTSK